MSATMELIFQRNYTRTFNRVMEYLRPGDQAELWSFDDAESRLRMEAAAALRGIQLHARSAYKPLLHAFLEDIDFSEARAIIVRYPVSRHATAQRFRLEAYPLTALIGHRRLEFLPREDGASHDYLVDLVAEASAQQISVFTPNRLHSDLTGASTLSPTGWLKIPMRDIDMRIETDYEQVYEDAISALQRHEWPDSEPFFEELNFSVELPVQDEALDLAEESMSLREALHEELYFSALEFFTLKSGRVLGDRSVQPGQIVPEVNHHPDRVSLSVQARPYELSASPNHLQVLSNARKLLSTAQISSELAALGGTPLSCKTVAGRTVLAGYIEGEDLPVLISAAQHANETSGVVGALRAAHELVKLKRAHFIVLPCENPDGYALQQRLSARNPGHMNHAARYTALGDDLENREETSSSRLFEKQLRLQALQHSGAGLHINLHGYPAHEWTRPLTGYVPRGFAAWTMPKGFFLILRHGNDAKAQAIELLNKVTQHLGQIEELVQFNARQLELYEAHAGPAGFQFINGIPCLISQVDQAVVPVTLITEYPDETIQGDAFVAAHTAQMETVLAAYHAWQTIGVGLHSA